MYGNRVWGSKIEPLTINEHPPCVIEFEKKGDVAVKKGILMRDSTCACSCNVVHHDLCAAVLVEKQGSFTLNTAGELANNR